MSADGQDNRESDDKLQETHRYALTLGQRWIATASRNADSALPIQRLYRISGDLDTRRLLTSLRSVLDESEVLRLRLHGDDGSWEQSFPGRDLVIDAVAPTGGTAAKRFDWALAYLATKGATAPDLDRAGPFSVQLVRLDSNTHILGLTVDHLAVDAVGFDLLEDRLNAAYRGEARASLAGRFSAYLATSRVSDAEQDRALAYWLDLLKHLPQTFSSGERVRGRRTIVTWRGSPLDQCLEACRRTRWSPFMALLAALALLMAHLSGRLQVVLNTPFSNRVTDEERYLLANLAILTHLPIQLDPDEPVRRFRDRLRRLVIMSMAHRNYDPWLLSVRLAHADDQATQAASLVAGCNFLKSPVSQCLGEPMSLDAMLPFSLRPGTLIVTCKQSERQFDVEVIWDPESWPLTDGSELFTAFRLATCSDEAQRVGDLLRMPLSAEH